MKPKLPKFFYKFSYQREPLWILIFSLLLPLIGILAAIILPRLAR